MSTGAIIVAAGRSSRMSGVDKLLYMLAGKALIARTAAPFLAHADIGLVALVVAPQSCAAVEAAVGNDPKLAIVAGGERRRDSVYAGLMALADCEYVIVHDGARPLVTSELIDAALEGARACGASLCAVPVADTVKRGEDGGYVRGTVSREGLWLAQTPQAFRRDLLLRAHQELEGDFTDDAAMIEQLGLPVRLVPGSSRNIKVTTPEDLALVEALLS